MVEPITHEAIEQAQKRFAASKDDQKVTKQPSSGFCLNVPAYLGKYGFEVVKTKNHGSSTLYCLKHCVFDQSHNSNESAIGQTADGKLFYQCFHNSCKDKRWHEARQIISGSDPLFDRPAVCQESGIQGFSEISQPPIKRIVTEKSLSFPYHVMTGAAGFFANVYASIVEAPEHFLFMAYLTCLGAVVPKLLTNDSELRTQPRLYVVLVGESASDRKSTTLKIADNHFRNVVEGFNSCWGVGSAEGLQKLLNKNKTHDSPGTILILDELKSFVNKCKIDSSILLPSVNTLFESNRFESHTKNKSIEIENAHLCILAASTLNTYERIYTPAFIDIGFLNRIFLVVGTAKRQFSFPEKVALSDINEMKNNLVKVLQHVGNGLELNITPEAKELFHNWYVNLEASVHARRLDGYAHRFMLLLAVNNLKNEIDTETVQHAIDLCDWQLEIRKIHDPIDADSEIAKMEEKIRRVLIQGPLKDRDLKQKTHANRTGLWVYNSALKNLQNSKESGWDGKSKQWFLSET